MCSCYLTFVSLILVYTFEASSKFITYHKIYLLIFISKKKPASVTQIENKNSIVYIQGCLKLCPFFTNWTSIFFYWNFNIASSPCHWVEQEMSCEWFSSLKIQGVIPGFFSLTSALLLFSSSYLSKNLKCLHQVSHLRAWGTLGKGRRKDCRNQLGWRTSRAHGLPNKSANHGSYGLTETVATSIRSAWLYTSSSIHVLWLLASCFFVRLLTCGYRCASDSFVCHWDSFPPALIALLCLDMRSLLVLLYFDLLFLALSI